MSDTNTATVIAMPSTQPTAEQMWEELAKLRAENERLKAVRATGRALSFKVSEKGALSVYGLGRFPVTLYRGQWEKLMAAVDEVKAFIQANADKLAVKE